ncbi:hypothetical protein [Anaerosacchariphilus polymeriproducens]|uniref:Peptidase C-terminal archaeal/bacterial domain-containing protein n=1 Tax=Anaerosacchariphilus polymeriproducens TaxID=1812858 RepID=A0A371AW95_9FIRM|nr:hypothetical protein [Anaerosacchariphilus polymeriproducens]RDU23846.1 hypothetical protein DWV06_08285 [Anaerosacchariphilus polymeriproducens]
MKKRKVITTTIVMLMALAATLSPKHVVVVNAAQTTENVSELTGIEHTEDNKFSIKDTTAQMNDVFNHISVNNENKSKLRESGHTTPDTAIYLDSSYLSKLITDSASDTENWYYFNMSSKNKISVILEQPSDGDYDIYLYQYKEDGTLSLISYSIYGGSSMENLSAVGEAGYYFLRVVPVKAAANENVTYRFMIAPIATYDSCEPDDIPDFATEYTDYINTNNTIDNGYDEDWSKLTVSSDGTYLVSLSNIPAESTYNIYIYDASFNGLGNMSCSANKSGSISLGTGSYYICVASEKGFNAAASYNLKVLKRKDSNSNIIYTKTGQFVEMTHGTLYVNGNAVNMNWKYHYTANYRRIQDVETNAKTSFYPGYLKNGTYNGPQSVSSKDCIQVLMNNFKYTYFCSLGYDFRYLTFGDNDYAIFYVDAVTGKVIDTNINYYFVELNMPQKFTEFK